MGFSNNCLEEISDTLTCTITSLCSGIDGTYTLIYDGGYPAWLSAPSSVCTNWRIYFDEANNLFYIVRDDFGAYAVFVGSATCGPFVWDSSSFGGISGAVPCSCNPAHVAAASVHIEEAVEDDSSSSSSISTSSVSSVSSASSSSSSISTSSVSSASSSSSSSSSSTSSQSTSSSSVVLANRKGNRLSGRRCCCLRCGEIYWMDRQLPFPASDNTVGNVLRDGTKFQGTVTVFPNPPTGSTAPIRYGRYNSRFYNAGRWWSCTGATTTAITGTAPRISRAWDVDELNGYIYWISGQSGSTTLIRRTAIDGSGTTTVATLDYASGPFSGGDWTTGTFSEIRIDTTNDGIYLVDEIVGTSLNVYRMALSGAAPLAKIYPLSGGSVSPIHSYLAHNVAPGHLYFLSNSLQTLYRINLDGTGITTVATHASGFLGVEASLDETEIYTFRKAGVASTDYDLIRIDAETFEVEVVVPYTSMTVRGPLTLSF